MAELYIHPVQLVFDYSVAREQPFTACTPGRGENAPMPNRPDMSPNLIHFIRARSSDEAMVTLREITGSGCLKGSNTTTRGGFHTISFTETPLRMMAEPLLAGHYDYSPFGIQVSKKWLFARGGRNVAYQTAEEFGALPEDYRWRHVRYEPHVENGVDFHWEREWRVRAYTLEIDPTCATIIVPTLSGNVESRRC